MQYLIEKRERSARRNAMVLAISLHLAFVSMLYFKMTAEASNHQPLSPPAKASPVVRPITPPHA